MSLPTPNNSCAGICRWCLESINWGWMGFGWAGSTKAGKTRMVGLAKWLYLNKVELHRWQETTREAEDSKRNNKTKHSELLTHFLKEIINFQDHFSTKYSVKFTMKFHFWKIVVFDFFLTWCYPVILKLFKLHFERMAVKFLIFWLLKWPKHFAQCRFFRIFVIFVNCC